MAGPTAAGKSGLAVALAKRWDAEIVSADPFQLFDALPVLTARPGPEELGAAPHHLYGTVPSDAPMDAARYRSLAQPLVEGLVRQGRQVIVVGGSGLYLKVLTHGLDPLPPPDPVLRAELEARPLADLATELRELDPCTAARIDLRNPRRVVRALEVCRLAGRPLSECRKAWDAPVSSLLGLLLDPGPEVLQARIAARIDAMFAAGVVGEVGGAERIGPALAQAIGFREIKALLAGQSDAAACREAILHATMRYAKRQRTWFRKQPGYLRIETAQPSAAEERLSDGPPGGNESWTRPAHP